MSFGTMANTKSAEFKKKGKSNTTTQLEVESRRMEERLRMLKQMMSAEKARREVEGGFLWEAGQKGPLLRRNKTDPTISTAKTTLVANSNSGHKRNKEKIRVKILSDKNDPDSKTSETVRCGQCDKSTASLSCVECLENYCQLCYAKFHHKGALASHHAKPVSSKQSKSHKTSPQKATTAVNTAEVSCKTASHVIATNHSERQSHSSKPHHENSLLDGTYDEKESAASFQQALAEWRGQAAVKTTSEAQAYSTKDSESATVSSAGMQAGEAVVGRLKKTHPQIQFSGKSGVTYFEQLMMKRHRYDPMVLSRAKQNTLSGDGVEAALDCTADDRDIPIDDEGTPSQYNIFYDPELTESSYKTVDDSASGDYTASSAALSVATSDVKIVELSVGHSVATANPGDVTIKPNQINEQERNNSVKVATKSNKVDDAKRPKSVSKKQMHNSRSKSKPRSVPPKPAIPHFRSSRPPSVASVVSESNLEESVKRAWTHCSGQTQLSQFFLQGVEHGDADIEEETRHIDKVTPVVFSKSKLSSTVWLPGNSTSDAMMDDDIDPATDLPPLMMDKLLPQNQPDHLYSNDSQSESGDEDCAINELELSVSNLEDRDICERQERDEEDDKTLENLAWELASTVECEGRLTRCESELGEEEGDISTPPFSPQPAAGESNPEPFPLTDLSQVMNEFELFMHQQTALEQDSD